MLFNDLLETLVSLLLRREVNCFSCESVVQIQRIDIYAHCFSLGIHFLRREKERVFEKLFRVPEVTSVQDRANFATFENVHDSSRAMIRCVDQSHVNTFCSF